MFFGWAKRPTALGSASAATLIGMLDFGLASRVEAGFLGPPLAHALAAFRKWACARRSGIVVATVVGIGNRQIRFM